MPTPNLVNFSCPEHGWVCSAPRSAVVTCSCGTTARSRSRSDKLPKSQPRAKAKRPDVLHGGAYGSDPFAYSLDAALDGVEREDVTNVADPADRAEAIGRAMEHACGKPAGDYARQFWGARTANAATNKITTLVDRKGVAESLVPLPWTCPTCGAHFKKDEDAGVREHRILCANYTDNVPIIDDGEIVGMLGDPAPAKLARHRTVYGDESAEPWLSEAGATAIDSVVRRAARRSRKRAA